MHIYSVILYFYTIQDGNEPNVFFSYLLSAVTACIFFLFLLQLDVDARNVEGMCTSNVPTSKLNLTSFWQPQIMVAKHKILVTKEKKTLCTILHEELTEIQ